MDEIKRFYHPLLEFHLWLQAAEEVVDVVLWHVSVQVSQVGV